MPGGFENNAIKAKHEIDDALSFRLKPLPPMPQPTSSTRLPGGS